MNTAALPRWPILLVMIVSDIMDLLQGLAGAIHCRFDRRGRVQCGIFAAHPDMAPDLALSAALTIQAFILVAFMGVTIFFPTAAKSELEVSHA